MGMTGTGGTMNLGGGVKPGPVQGKTIGSQVGVIVSLYYTSLPEIVMDTLKHGKTGSRFHRVQQIPDMHIRGNIPHPKQIPRVVSSLFLLHQELVLKKRRTLGKEDRESRQGDISQGILDILPVPAVRKIPDHIVEETQ
jgi:hypothetical protein